MFLFVFFFFCLDEYKSIVLLNLKFFLGKVLVMIL